MEKKIEYMNLFRCMVCEKYRNKEPLKICDECKKDPSVAKQYKLFLMAKKVKKPKKTREEQTAPKVEKYLKTKPEGATINQIVKDTKIQKEKVKNAITTLSRRRESTKVVSKTITLYMLETLQVEEK